jgi:hypothetical protein
MELQDMPVVDKQTESILSPEDQEMDRIAFELWQRGSLPELVEDMEAELEEVAGHASCL